MRSAAVLALSRLMFEYANDDLSVQSLLPSVLKTVLMLSDDPSREVIKSMVGFVRVSVAACPPEELQPLLPDVLNGLLKYHRGKDRFRSKIKIIIKKLVKVFGYGTLMPLVPESDSRLLTHMKKISEREARRKKSLRDQRNSKLCHFDDMVASDEEDSDGGRTLVTAATGITKLTNSSGRQMLKRRRRHARENENESMAFSAKSRSDVTVRLKNDSDGNVFDVEDLTKKTVRFVHPSDDSDSEGPIEFDVSGKLVVTDGHRETATTNDDEALVSPSQSSSPVEGSIRSTHKAQQKDRNNARKLGLPYKAKKAGGDVRKKGQQYDPYAYVPLDGRSYTKKNRRNAVEQMSTVVKSGRKRQKR
jgi:ribosomal RNA-processing protein 12